MQLPSSTLTDVLDDLMMLRLVERFDAPLTGAGYKWLLKNEAYTMLSKAKLLWGQGVSS